MQSPQINGNYYSFANIEFRVNGLFILGIKSINYGNKVGSTFVRGTNQMPLGTTQGQYEPKCDIEILRPQFNLFLAALLDSYPGLEADKSVQQAIKELTGQVQSDEGKG